MRFKSKTTLRIAYCIVCNIFVAASAAAETVAEDTNFVFSVDTRGGPFVVSSLAAAQALPYWTGESVAIVAPSGTITEPVSLAVADGSYSWTPNAAGFWTLTNDGEGAAIFNVWYSLFPSSSGAGTEVDPVKAVDGEDLAALISGGSISEDGCFVSGGSLPAGGFTQPSGYGYAEVGDGVYRLTAAPGGVIFSGLDTPLILDTVLPGPDRIMHKRETMPLSYSGDSWLGFDDAAPSVLRIDHARDARPAQTLYGTGSQPFVARRSGVYTVILDDDSTTFTSHINVREDRTVFFLR